MLGKALKDILLYSPIKLLTPLISFITFPINLWYFTQEEYGIIALITATTSLINTTTVGWISPVIIRYYERYKLSGKLGEFLSVFWRTTIVLCLVIIGLLAGMYFLGESKVHISSANMVLIPLSIISGIIGGNLISLLQLNGQSRKYNLYGLLISIGNTGVFLICIFVFKLRIESTFIAGAVTNCLFILLEGRVLRREFGISARKWNTEIFKDGLKYGIPQIGVTLGALLLSVADRYIVQYYFGANEVGIYSAAYRIGEMLIMLPTGIIASVVAPTIFREYEKGGMENAKYIIRHFVILYLFFLLPFVLFISIQPEILLPFIGKKYVEALPMIAPITFGILFFGICHFTCSYLQILEKPSQFMLIIIISSAINIALNFILIPRFQLMGAAYATFLAYACYFVLIDIFSVRRVKENFFNKRMVALLVATAPMIVAFYLFKLVPFSFLNIVLLIISVGMYLFLLYFFKEPIIARSLDLFKNKFKNKIIVR